MLLFFRPMPEQLLKILLLADLHITTLADHPERFSALKSIINQAAVDGQAAYILAGDLFDAPLNNYSEFDAICKQFPGIQIHIIPGNHDPDISQRQIVAPNVTIYTQPTLVHLDPHGPPFLFLPYEKSKTMGERIAGFASQLQHDNWVLVAHGDYLDGLREGNTYEESRLYMPLTRRDITTFRPARVFLGHIHAPLDKDPVYYTGSPCGLDISETGQRRYLVYDTQTGAVESRRVNSDVLFYNETLTILPMEDETAYLCQKAQTIIQGWGLEPADYSKVRMRLKVNGYTTDKNNALHLLKDCFTPFRFYEDEDIDSSELSDSRDPDRILLSEMVQQSIAQQTWPDNADGPTQDEILQAALGIIYGGKNGGSH
jgi:DNA repair protein SbcD/Mre11